MTTPSLPRTAFIGLGAMGYPMAGHLQTSGHRTVVYNRSADKSTRWQAQYAGEVAPSPAEAAAQADIVMVCVGNDDDVRSVLLGAEGAIARMKPGAVLVDHTTASVELARELHERCSDCRLGCLDAPVSGGQAGAENGQLTIMAGGTEAVFAKASPVLKVYAKSLTLMGEAGAGQLTKMVNQICIAGVLQGLAEGLHFAERAGLDSNAVIDAISQGAAQSWQMDNRHNTMIEDRFDFGFAVDWMRKDLGIVLAAARQLDVSLPLTALVDQFYGDVQNLGGGRWDTSSLIARLRALSGHTPHSG